LAFREHVRDQSVTQVVSEGAQDPACFDRAPGRQSESAPAVRLDHSLWTSAGWPRPLEWRFALQLTTDGHTASRLNALRPMCLSRASMSACHCSVRPRPCSGSRSWAREDAASAVRPAVMSAPTAIGSFRSYRWPDPADMFNRCGREGSCEWV